MARTAFNARLGASQGRLEATAVGSTPAPSGDFVFVLGDAEAGRLHELASGESSKRCTRHLLLNRSLHTAMVRADHRGQDLLGQGRPSTGLGCNDGQPNRHIQKIVPAEVRCKNSPAQRSATAMTTGASLHPRQRSTRDRSGNLGRSFSR